MLGPYGATQDVESSKEIAPHDELKESPRKCLPTWKWILSLVGLYLGALLYGI